MNPLHHSMWGEEGIFTIVLSTKYARRLKQFVGAENKAGQYFADSGIARIRKLHVGPRIIFHVKAVLILNSFARIFSLYLVSLSTSSSSSIRSDSLLVNLSFPSSFPTEVSLNLDLPKMALCGRMVSTDSPAFPLSRLLRGKPNGTNAISTPSW